MLATPDIIRETAQPHRLMELVPEWQRVPLYRDYPFHRLAAEAAVDIPVGFDQFPFTSKRDILRDFPRNFFQSGQSLERLLENDLVELEHTSGTSEEQLPVVFQRDWWDAQEERALRLNPFVRRVLDQHPNVRRATLTTPACNGRVCFSAWRSRARRTMGTTLFVNQARIPFLLSDEEMARMAAEITDWSPQFLDVDPVHGACFALYCEKQRVRFPSLQFVLCSYEFVSVVHRSILQRVFGVPVFDLYGSTETGHLLMEGGENSPKNSRLDRLNPRCSSTRPPVASFSPQRGEGLRMRGENYSPPPALSLEVQGEVRVGRVHGDGAMLPCLENALLEVIEPDADDVGELAVTTLTNGYMPLLRYRIGDLVERQVLPYETVYRVHGRLRDALRAKNGHRVTTWQVDQCFDGIEGVLHYQLHQAENGACQLRFIPDGAGPKADSLKNLVSRLEMRLQSPGRIEVESVQLLPPTPSGKFRLTSSAGKIPA